MEYKMLPQVTNRLKISHLNVLGQSTTSNVLPRPLSPRETILSEITKKGSVVIDTREDRFGDSLALVTNGDITPSRRIGDGWELRFPNPIDDLSPIQIHTLLLCRENGSLCEVIGEQSCEEWDLAWEVYTPLSEAGLFWWDSGTGGYGVGYHEYKLTRRGEKRLNDALLGKDERDIRIIHLEAELELANMAIERIRENHNKDMDVIWDNDELRELYFQHREKES